MRRSEQQMIAYYERLLVDFGLPVIENIVDDVDVVTLVEESCVDTVPYVEFEVSGRHEIN